MEIQIEEYDKLTIISLVGDFYIGNIMQIETEWEKVIEKRPATVAFNCKKLQFIDSSAIGTLVKFLNNSDRYNIKMVFYALSSSIIRIFKTAKLSALFKIYSEDEFIDQFLSNYSKK